MENKSIKGRLRQNILKLRDDQFFRRNVVWNLLFALIVAFMVLAFAILSNIRIVDESITDSLVAFSRTLAAAPDIVQALENGEMSEPAIKRMDEVIEQTDFMDIISIADNASTRIYHPEKERIGGKFEGGDEHFFEEKGSTYVTTSSGSLGKQRRAFSQVRDEDGEVLGFVMVSSLTSHIIRSYNAVLREFIPLTIVILAFAFLLSVLSAYSLNRHLLGHNPGEFVRIFLRQNDLFEALEEGILAIDRNGSILFSNKMAANVYKCTPEELQGKAIRDILPDCQLEEVLHTGVAEYNREKKIKDNVFLLDRIPLFESGKISGAMCIYRDKTEMTRIAEDMTGVGHIVEALRSNMHEFKNNLHIILGMLQLEEYDLCRQYIKDLNMESIMLSNVTKCVENKTLAALIYGKINIAREHDITMNIAEGSYLPAHNEFLSTNQMVTVLGNLLQNAIDATENTAMPREIELCILTDENRLKITVDDTGCGMDEQTLQSYCERGYSTKGPGRGIGMDLVDAIVSERKGTMLVDSSVGEGTTFVLEFTNKR